MENRRPPRSNSFGRKPYSDRGRAAPPFRGGPQQGDGADRSARRPNSAADGRYKDRTGIDPRRRDGRPGGGFTQNNGKPHRFDKRSGPGGQNRTGVGSRQTLENEIRITSDAQITDGKFRGQALKNSDSPKTIPTGRKLREIFFKVISKRIKAGRVLDLGAGPGTIGIEALSRGAMLVTFVERSARMCTFIRKNLAEMGVKDGHGEIVEMEILPFLIKAGRRKRSWDVVYFDMGVDDHEAIFEHLCRGTGLRPGGLLLMEHASGISHPDNISSLRRWRTIDQGETILSIYERI